MAALFGIPIRSAQATTRGGGKQRSGSTNDNAWLRAALSQAAWAAARTKDG